MRDHVMESEETVMKSMKETCEGYIQGKESDVMSDSLFERAFETEFYNSDVLMTDTPDRDDVKKGLVLNAMSRVACQQLGKEEFDREMVNQMRPILDGVTRGIDDPYNKLIIGAENVRNKQFDLPADIQRDTFNSGTNYGRRYEDDGRPSFDGKGDYYNAQRKELLDNIIERNNPPTFDEAYDERDAINVEKGVGYVQNDYGLDNDMISILRDQSRAETKPEPKPKVKAEDDGMTLDGLKAYKQNTSMSNAEISKEIADVEDVFGESHDYDEDYDLGLD